MILHPLVRGAWLLALTSPALAGDDPPVDTEVSGHVKSFALATFPYEYEFPFEGFELIPSTPTGQGVLDSRLNLAVQYKSWLRFEAAHAVTGMIGPTTTGGVTQTGVAIEAPEAIPLSWKAFDEEGSTFTLSGRTDRLFVKVRVPHLDLTLGRQPISFGTGMFFTPLDLVNPFTPATIDSEYKPGVDAFRADGFIGVSTRITAVAAYAGDWTLEGMTFALNGQTTVGVTDLGLFYGLVHGDNVFGASVVSGIGPVGIHADAAVTLPYGEDEDVFFRGVVGADGRPTNTTTIFGEVYVQTFGLTDYGDLAFTQLISEDRYARGEVWTVGVLYAGLGISQEIVPTFTANLTVLGNLLDPSAFLAPGVSWSVSENADVIAGGYVGLGKRPDDELITMQDFEFDLGVQSEFGLLPTTFFVQVRSYF